MSTDNGTAAQRPADAGQGTDAGARPGTSRRRRRAAIAAGAAAAGLIVVGAPVTAMGLTGTFSPAPAAASRSNAEGNVHWTAGRAAAPNAAVKAAGKAAAADPGYDAYVALSSGYEVAQVSVATDTIISTAIGDDSGEGVAVTPDGNTVYVANTGQYSVLAANPTTGAETTIFVGAYPQDDPGDHPGRSGAVRGHGHA